MFKSNKNKALSAVPVVVILMLCGVVVSIFTFGTGKQTTNTAIDTTYEAYEILTEEEINVPVTPEHPSVTPLPPNDAPSVLTYIVPNRQDNPNEYGYTWESKTFRGPMFGIAVYIQESVLIEGESEPRIVIGLDESSIPLYAEDVYIPITITTIKEEAFGNATGATIYYSGTVEQWEEIDKALNWDAGLVSAIICTDGALTP